MDNKERAAFNTIILYIKLIFTTIISLYTSRVVLLMLGVEDFGINSLVTSIVGMLSFVSSSLAVSTQRFLSYHLGTGDMEVQKKIVSSSLILHILIALAIALVLVVLEPFVFNSSIQVPENRLNIARILYFLMISGMVFTVVSVPYSATINAHENMLIESIIGIIEDLFKLFGVILITKVAYDKLLLFGLLNLFLPASAFVIRWFYCASHYRETRFNFTLVSKSYLKEIGSFSIWNTVGAFAVVCRMQGVSIVLNVFNGVFANAAYGICMQVSGAMRNVAATLQKALNPQIMKNEGDGQHNNMVRLALYQCKYTFILLLLLCLPLIVDMGYVLELWLKKVPDEAVVFCQLVLVLVLLQQVTSGLQVAIQAVGRIKEYQITISIVIMLTVVFSYIFLKLGMPSYSVIVAMIIVEVISMIIRPVFAKKYAGVDIGLFMKRVIVPIVFISIISYSIVIILFILFPVDNNFIKLVLLLVYSSTIICILTYMTMTVDEKNIFYQLIVKKLLKK